eukprot:comp20286_c0_seq1/m.25449 comp20286_c0_seq1/g.25449  ORF comp20286_c0_seq1/g.25449 comp20286_c0_seq1/m.25449 type:complete len:327 (-) comp20286_c0_seq1:776-1756(-)
MHRVGGDVSGKLAVETTVQRRMGKIKKKKIRRVEGRHHSGIEGVCVGSACCHISSKREHEATWDQTQHRLEQLRLEVARLQAECDEITTATPEAKPRPHGYGPGQRLATAYGQVPKFVEMQLAVARYSAEIEMVQEVEAQGPPSPRPILDELRARQEACGFAAAARDRQVWADTLVATLEGEIARETAAVAADRQMLQDIEKATSVYESMLDGATGDSPICGPHARLEMHVHECMQTLHALLQEYFHPAAPIYRELYGPRVPPFTSQHEHPSDTLQEVINAFFHRTDRHLPIEGRHWQPFLDMLVDWGICLRNPTEHKVCLIAFHI